MNSGSGVFVCCFLIYFIPNGNYAIWMVTLLVRLIHSNIMVRFFWSRKNIFLGIFNNINILEMHSVYLYASLNNKEPEEDNFRQCVEF